MKRKNALLVLFVLVSLTCSLKYATSPNSRIANLGHYITHEAATEMGMNDAEAFGAAIVGGIAGEAVGSVAGAWIGGAVGSLGGPATAVFGVYAGEIAGSWVGGL